jgi:hypothetical protein
LNVGGILKRKAMARLKLEHHVNIAIRAEVIAHNWPEEAELLNTIFAAKGLNLRHGKRLESDLGHSWIVLLSVGHQKLSRVERINFNSGQLSNFTQWRGQRFQMAMQEPFGIALNFVKQAASDGARAAYVLFPMFHELYRNSKEPSENGLTDVQARAHCPHFLGGIFIGRGNFHSANRKELFHGTLGLHSFLEFLHG